MKVTQKPRIYYDWRAEMINPVWPKQSVHLDLGELEEQKRLDVWRVLIERELAELRRIESKLADRDESPSHEQQESLKALNEVWALLALPEKATAAGRKRVFGAIPPVDEHDAWIFSWFELQYLAAAFWDISELRQNYIGEIRKAEAIHDRQTRAARLLDDLQNEM